MATWHRLRHYRKGCSWRTILRAANAGLCGPTLPYPPGMLVTHSFLASATGLDAFFLCRLLGLGSLSLFSTLAILMAVRTGVKLSFAIAAFVLISFFLKPGYAYKSCFDILGDSVVLNCSLCIALLAKSFERPTALSTVLISCLLLGAFIFKAQGACLYGGVLLFVATRPAMPVKTKLWIAAILALGGLLVVVLLASVPNCWGSTIVAMQHHAIDRSKLRSEVMSSIHFLWPFCCLPFAVLVSRLGVVSSPSHLWHWFRRSSATTRMLCCMIPFYAAIQTLALAKEGGAAYNLDFAFMMAIPLVILGSYRALRHGPVFATLVSIIATIGFVQASISSLRSIKSVEPEIAYLSTEFPNAKVIAFAQDYVLTHKAGLSLETDIITVWHYQAGGFDTPKMNEAVKSQLYDLAILSPSEGGSEDATEGPPFLQLIGEYYSPVADAKLPPSLKGRLFKRRQLPVGR